MGGLYLLAAYRWDSRTALGLGVAADLRASAIVLGTLYTLAAGLSVRLARKAHFEEVFANAGLLLLLGGLLAGALDDGPAWSAWLLATLVVAAGVMAAAFRLRRSLYFAIGLVAAYVALVRLLFQPFRSGPHADSVPLLLAALLGLAALAVVFWAHRRMRER